MQEQEPFCDISFAEKVTIFSKDYLKCCLFISGAEAHSYTFSKKLYSKLIGTSHVLEDFLDFHGAKNNEDWYFYRELCSAVRHLSLGGYCQKHILNRLVFYELEDTVAFRSQGEQTIDFLNNSLSKLAPVILDEARRLNIPYPHAAFGPEDFPGITTSEMLKYNIDDDAKDQQKKNIVPGKVNEVETRRFEMLVHNLQSSFDTYVIHGGFRF